MKRTNAEDQQKQEIFCLKEMLSSASEQGRNYAVKRVVALMRSGENVSILFPSMLYCVNTQNISIKKMVYLYLVNYASQEPEHAIMTVSTFIRDTQDSSPVVRALAVRMMCRIKLDTVAENFIIPLKHTLKDKDPYVRKTAAMAVAKLYDIIPDVVENAQLCQELLKLLGDENPMVVSNATAALFEINDRRTSPVFEVNEETTIPILAAMTQCSASVQCILLDALYRYSPKTSEEAGFLIDRLIPLLKNADAAVVVGAFKCILQFIPLSLRPPPDVFKVIIPPFITLLSMSTEPEIQFVILRTINLFVQKYPKALTKEIRVFMCSYNDPSYIKLEKLDIIVALTAPMIVSIVLNELEEYCNSVDVAFVRKSIQSVTKIALQMEMAARRCVDILSKQVKSHADYALEEATISITQILRRYPGYFDGIIEPVLQQIERLKDPESRASAIWMVGEFNDQIEDVASVLDFFLDQFDDDPLEVQLQLLTAIVKVYLKKKEEVEDQLQFVLNEATKPSQIPDLRNRALIYWRLLTADLNATSNLVFFKHEPPSYEAQKLDPSVLDELLRNVGSVCGVLHVVPNDFVKAIKYLPDIEDQQLLYKRVRSVNDFIELDYAYTPSTLCLRVTSKYTEPLNNFAFALNKNPFGAVIEVPPEFPSALSFGDSFEFQVPLTYSDAAVSYHNLTELECALRTNIENSMFNVPIQPQFLLQMPPEFEQGGFDSLWSGYDTQIDVELPSKSLAPVDTLCQKNVRVVSESGPNKQLALSIIPGSTVLVRALQTQKVLTLSIRGNRNSIGLVEKFAKTLFCI